MLDAKVWIGKVLYTLFKAYPGKRLLHLLHPGPQTISKPSRLRLLASGKNIRIETLLAALGKDM